VPYERIRGKSACWIRTRSRVSFSTTRSARERIPASSRSDSLPAVPPQPRRASFPTSVKELTGDPLAREMSQYMASVSASMSSRRETLRYGPILPAILSRNVTQHAQTDRVYYKTASLRCSRDSERICGNYGRVVSARPRLTAHACAGRTAHNTEEFPLGVSGIAWEFLWTLVGRMRGVAAGARRVRIATARRWKFFLTCRSGTSKRRRGTWCVSSKPICSNPFIRHRADYG